MLSMMVQYSVVIGAMAALVFATMSATLLRPAWVATGLIMAVCVLTQPSAYAQKDISVLSLFYVLGSNTFNLSLFEIFMLVIWACAVFLIPKPPAISPEADKAAHRMYLAYGVLAIMVLLFLLAEPAEAFSEAWWMHFNNMTFITMVWQGIFIFVCTTLLRTRRDVRRLATAMVVVLVLNHVWGMVRYAALGGDPQNAYAALEKLAVKITFWDINDSVMAAFLVGYGLFRVLAEPGRSPFWRKVDLLVVLLAVASVALSARRTAQIGLLLALLATLVCLPKGKRAIVILVMAACVPVALVVTAQRSTGSGSVIEKVLIDVKFSKVEDPRRSRFYEWRKAWHSIRETPWIGLGPRGTFRVIDDTGLEYHRNNYGFIHSGFGHILLKSGFVGLSIYLFIWVIFIRHVKRSWAGLPNSVRPICVGAVAALFAALPNFIVGTPVIEIRTMLVLSVMMSILLVCSRFSSGHRDQLWDESATVFVEYRH